MGLLSMERQARQLSGKIGHTFGGAVSTSFEAARQRRYGGGGGSFGEHRRSQYALEPKQPPQAELST